LQGFGLAKEDHAALDFGPVGKDVPSGLFAWCWRLALVLAVDATQEEILDSL